MKRVIAVVGATGFVGNALVRHWAGCGHSVTGYSTKRRVNLPSTVKSRKYDATQDDIEFIDGTDAVFYLSQSPYYRQFSTHPDHILKVNVVGAVKAAVAAEKAGVRLFCYASTGNVYQPSFDSLTEDHAIRRDNGYSLSKVMAEEALNLLHGAMSILSVRLFGIFGPDQTQMLVPRIFERVRRSQPIQLELSGVDPTDHEGLRVSYCFLDDLVHCFEKLMDMALDGARIPNRLNVAGPESISIQRLATEQAALLGIPPHFVYSEKCREFDLTADITRMRQICDPTFTDFSEAIATTFRSVLLKAAS